ncbi:Protein of unknown function DUF3605 [Ceraceosorus bombacis]|uniref:Uncharacterized protein n=1 Tax=Ceraceosorus bombacis TaxID=401625 RepID=A0A0P1BL20_9BASI|nr:Protein of unknown function DUF3605 [Ceraceosorus bombacis]
MSAASGSAVRLLTTTSRILPPVPALGEAHSASARALLRPRLIEVLQSQGLELDEAIGEGFWSGPRGQEHAERHDDEELMAWHLVGEVCANGDLDRLVRLKACDRAYLEWAKPIRTKWGGLENYIRVVRLGWPNPEAPLPAYLSKTTGNDEGAGASQAQVVLQQDYFLDTDDETLVRRVPNDWPYAIPEDCEHWVVWSRKEIYTRSLFFAPNPPWQQDESFKGQLWSAIVKDGIRGHTGSSSNSNSTKYTGWRTLEHLQESLALTATPAEIRELAESAQSWTGREVSKYVKRTWDEEQWETNWFCNPPHLRTVPGLSHFQRKVVAS